MNLTYQQPEILELPGITLVGFAQGGICTSIYVRELKCAFDAGIVLPMVDSFEKYFITHFHPDHCGALPTILARRTTKRAGESIIVHVPNEKVEELSSVFSIMENLYGDRSVYPGKIIGHHHGDIINIGNGYSVKALKTYHGVASCGWSVSHTVKKLKDEFIGKSTEEIIQAKNAGIEITNDTESLILTIPGDTMIEFLERIPEAQECKILVHEVTHWDDTVSVEESRSRGHTHVDNMIEHCEKFKGDHLVLVHRSMKYSRSFIEKVVKERFPSSMIPKIHCFDGDNK